MKVNDEKGQALVEFILFLPLLLIMYVSVVSIGNAINGSINQQKVSRGYFFSRILNNSTIPKPRKRDQAFKNWRRFGMFFIGYSERKDGNVPVAACYEMQLPFGSNEQACERYSNPTTRFVRVETAFGICGGTYTRSQGDIHWAYNLEDEVATLSDMVGCTIQ